MNPNYFVGLLGAVGSFALAVWGVIHGQNSDKRKADSDRQEWEQWIMGQVKQDNQEIRDKWEQLNHDYDVLLSKKDAMEQELNQQIALKVRENEQLKQRNVGLERENQEYRERYGKL